jgi:hypothetical protein
MTTINNLIIAATADDGEWNEGTTTYVSNGTQITLGLESSNVKNGYFRFQNVTIPQGATIDTAHVKLQPGTSRATAGVSLVIRANNVDDAANPANYAAAEALARTSASADWTPGTWTSGTDVQTPEIKTVIQEVVNRAGWVSGNDLAILIEDNGGTEQRTAKSRDHATTGSTDAARLYVEYTAGGISAPTTLAITGTSTAILTWVDTSSDETGFQVERSPDNGADAPTGVWTILTTVAAGVQTYTDTTVSPGVKYWYRVAAVKDVA